MRALRHLIPPLAGLAAALGQAPWSLWWLALPGYALGIALIAGSRRPFWTGFAFGIAHFALALIWITEPFRVDPQMTAWLAPVALAAVSLGFGLFWAVAGWVGTRLLGGPVGVAVAIALAEMLRSYLLTGFPWALPGHVLIGSAALPAASIAGAHGLGLAVLLGAALLALRRPVPAALGLALWALPFGIGAALPPAPPVPADAPVVRLIQPNAPQHLKWDPDWIGTFFRRGLELAARPAEGAGPVATVWPETALPELLGYSQDVRPMVARAAGTPVVIGAQRYDDDRRPRNTMLLLDRAGEVDLVHDKFRLVPFGEFLPMQPLFEAVGIGPLATALAGRFAPGAGPITFDLPGVGPVMPMICYEAIFPQDIPRVERPRAILHLTNDAWFGTRFGPQQHLALARLRAAESGLPLLRAANTGVSAVIDARGRVLDALPLGVAGFLDAALPPALPATPYMAIRDRGVLMLLAVLALGVFAAGRRNAVAATFKAV